MDYLRIRNWDKYQKIVGDKAPYVQLQTEILLDMEFMGLPDRERLCFLLLLAYAGRSKNKIPNDPVMIMHLCHFDDVPDLSLLVSRNYLEEYDEAQAIEKEEERKKYERRRKREYRASQKCPEDVPSKSRHETGDKRQETRDKRQEKEYKYTRKVELPDGFSISARVKRWAEKNNHARLDEHLEAFRHKASAKGYKYKNWDDAFMEAVRADWANLGKKAEPERDQFWGVE